MGFSPLGLAVGLAVLAPNLLLVWFPPRVGLPAVPVPAALRWLERVGQGLCLVVPAVTAPGGLVMWGVLPALVALAGYYALWARYLRTGRSGATLYRPWWRLPVPMAILPIVVFLSAAVWLGNPWIAVAALFLAAGHLPVSAMVARSLRRAAVSPGSGTTQ